MLLDSALGKHVRFALQLAVLIYVLQRTEQAVRAVVLKRHFIGAAVQQTIFLCISVIQDVQVSLFAPDSLVRISLQLVLYEPSRAVTQLNHAPYTVTGSDGHFDFVHARILAIVYLPVDERKAEITHIGVGGNGLCFILLKLIPVVFGDLSMNVFDGSPQLVGQICVLERLSGGFAPVAVHHVIIRHRSQHHVGVRREVAVDGYPVFGLGKMHPIQVCLNGAVAFL